ncbi:hypothetical protein AUC43_15270 [Hymenobacter sedentarius]|uniref:Uncharacterized protein n=1 Tax=Hymenobacter sedentarius TaxID=1411621 RepID=A0A0U3T0F2_9BACT|nr:hypothetical protein [Hymenobacter sedentarius]ALW86323.1 hypothetical protein AUC43_15270 [Hymenobacter sedentarius]
MKKIRLVFEAEVEQDVEITPDFLRRVWGRNQNFTEDLLSDEHWMESARHEEVLLKALLAYPKQYQQFLLLALQHSTETLTESQFLQLAGNAPNRWARREMDPIEGTVYVLPSESAAYFNKAISNGTFSEQTELIRESLRIDIKSIHIEEA